MTSTFDKLISIDYMRAIYIFSGVLVINLLFTLILLPWATDKDINGLVGTTFDKFITLFYFGVTIFTTTGFGDIYAKSNRLKVIIALYMLLIISIAIHIYA